jgi:NAD(P)-dependent dehydrogenase (short-subunit alcohol dehydrogenase family)
MQLKDKTAVVTGINGLLGSVWAETLLEEGAIVHGIDLKHEPLCPSAEKLKNTYKERFKVHKADVCNKESLEQVLSQINGVDILVNNAGIDQPPRPGKGYKVEEFPFEDFKRVVEVNLGGAFLCSQVFGKGMAARGNGVIINIGSLYASVSPDERFYDHMPMDPPFLKPPAYAASKAGLVNVTRYFAAHWGKYGVRVNTLSPGGVLGNQDPEFKSKFNSRVPLARMAEYKDLKGPLLFLASDASAYVTGQNLQVDGGFTIW